MIHHQNKGAIVLYNNKSYLIQLLGSLSKKRISLIYTKRLLMQKNKLNIQQIQQEIDKIQDIYEKWLETTARLETCLLYTSPSPRDS